MKGAADKWTKAVQAQESATKLQGNAAGDLSKAGAAQLEAAQALKDAASSLKGGAGTGGSASGIGSAKSGSGASDDFGAAGEYGVDQDTTKNTRMGAKGYTTDEALALIAKYESSGGQNIKNPISSASGPWQMLDKTWAGRGGFRHAMDAPISMQRQRATELFDAGGFGDWAPYNSKLNAAIQRGEGRGTGTSRDVPNGSVVDPPAWKATAADNPSEFTAAFGDSIAVGFKKAAGIGGNPVSGRNPAEVLASLNDTDLSKLEGKNVFLSSGASNINANRPNTTFAQQTAEMEQVKAQIDRLQSEGARVTLSGVGGGVANADQVNARLKQIAEDTGVGFTGQIPGTIGRVHPKEYNPLLEQASRVGNEGSAGKPTIAADTFARPESKKGGYKDPGFDWAFDDSVDISQQDVVLKPPQSKFLPNAAGDAIFKDKSIPSLTYPVSPWNKPTWDPSKGWHSGEDNPITTDAPSIPQAVPGYISANARLQTQTDPAANQLKSSVDNLKSSTDSSKQSDDSLKQTADSQKGAETDNTAAVKDLTSKIGSMKGGGSESSLGGSANDNSAGGDTSGAGNSQNDFGGGGAVLGVPDQLGLNASVSSGSSVSSLTSGFGGLTSALGIASSAASLFGGATGKAASSILGTVSSVIGLVSKVGGLFGGGSGGGLGGIGSIFSGITGLFSLFALEQGGVIPSAAGGLSVNDGKGGTLAIVHPRETVLPAHLSTGIQNMISRGGGNDNGSSSSGDTHHYNINVNSIDSRSGAQFLMAHSDSIARSLNRARRNFNPAA
jgi:hypothetical protein